MAKPRKNELVRCRHFAWRLFQRGGVWYADGRSNSMNPGRHSLGTRDRDEAMNQLANLDQVQAEDLGLAPKSAGSDTVRALPLTEGRRRYEDHIARPRIVGGTKPSTQKRYRAIFDKFGDFAKTKRISDWNQVTERTLEDYTTYLDEREYASKTVHNELTTLKQAYKWLCTEGYLNREPLCLPLAKPQSQRHYCYRHVEVDAMIEHCREQPELRWLGDVITALACTGLRISELASLRWTDIRVDSATFAVQDESGFAGQLTDRRSTKNGRTRHIPIRSELAEVFERRPRSGKYVFYGPRGGRLKPDTVRNQFVEHVIAKLADRFPNRDEDTKGFADGRLHSFRHYFCSACANSGIPERVVMEWLGHADSDMVRHYYHLSDEESRRQMDQVDLLGSRDGRSAAAEEQH